MSATISTPLLAHRPPGLSPGVPVVLPPPLPNRSFIYPLYGIPYILYRTDLHPILLSRLAPLLIVSLSTISILFVFLYIPHLAVLALFRHPFPVYYACIMILSESAAIVSILAESFFTEHQIIDIFDITFLDRTTAAKLNCGVDMVGRARVLGRDEGRGRHGEWVLGEHRQYPYLKFKESFKCSVLFLVELPLNLIPVFGTPLFFLLQAYHLGPLHHYHYFQLLGYNSTTRQEYIRQNRVRYIAFGLVHVLLQLIPVLNILFLFSTGAGAALWASKAEMRRYGVDDEGNRDGEYGGVVVTVAPVDQA